MDPKHCPKCHATIDADDPLGLCPACLLKEGLRFEETRARRVDCTSCQRTLGEDARFCANCGAAAPAPPTVLGDPVRTALETKLQSQYRVVRLLGRGGMGAVYLARDLTLDREVAVKVVKPDSVSQELDDRFRREARTAARLAHPNIVPLHAFGEVGGMPYFVMGYVRGESLAARLRRDGKLPEDEARRVLAEIADALDHAHRQGVVHRDIKPDNVLLEDESGRAMLMDFGVAKALGKGDTMTRAGSVVGTPHYMSPEQATGRADIDGRSDIYSLGVMAYAMLAGRLPFEGSTVADVLKKHMTQEPPSLRSLGATISDSTVQAVERCLAKDAARRWPDARSLKVALGAIEESSLPDALQAVEGKGILGAMIALPWLFFILLSRAPLAAKMTNVAVVAFLYVFTAARLRREGFSLRQSQSALWREPAWWLWWYPRALRRRGNVWDRLPAAVRHLRFWLPALVVYVFAGIATTRPRDYFTLKAAGMAAMVTLWAFLRVRAKRELIRTGLAPADVFRIMVSVPPSRLSFWARPHIAVVLAPDARPEPSRRSDSPHDQLQSILRHADELSGPLRPLGAEAGLAARQLLESIEQADREIAELARNLEPGEEERLAEKIEALAASPGRSDDYAPMRVLLEKQLVLIRGLSGRIEEAKESRNRRLEMLRTLALHLATLRARSAETPSAVRSLTDRVRALCDDISHQAAAHAEAGASAVGGPAHETATRVRGAQDR
jgi:predicted Ser/Thr protein kinase